MFMEAHTLRLKRMYQRKSEEVRSLIQISESSTSGYSPAGSNSGGSNAASGYVSPTQPGPSSLGLEASRSRSGSRPTSRSGIDLAAETGPSSARNAGKADVLISGASKPESGPMRGANARDVQHRPRSRMRIHRRRKTRPRFSQSRTAGHRSIRSSKNCLLHLPACPTKAILSPLLITSNRVCRKPSERLRSAMHNTERLFIT